MKIYMAVVFSYFCITTHQTNGEYPKFHPYRQKASVTCDEGSNFNIWVEDWEGHNLCLQIVYSNKIDLVAVYFDEHVDRNNSWTEIPTSERTQPHLTYHGRAQWMFNFTSNVWRYMTNTYENFGLKPFLYLLIHGNQITKTPQGRYYHYSHNEASKNDQKNRNILDLSSEAKNAWTSNETRNSEMDLIINQLFYFVENKFKDCLGLLSSDLQKYNSSLYSAWTDAFTINVYINISMTAHAQRYLKGVIRKDASNNESTQHRFRNRFYPIYTSDDCKRSSVPLHFQVIQNDVQKNAAHHNANLDFGEFVLIWSGATQTDLRQWAHNFIGWNDTYQKQYENATRKFHEFSRLFKKSDFDFTIKESAPPILANTTEQSVASSSTTFENKENTKPPTSTAAEIEKTPNISEKSLKNDNDVQIFIIAGASGAGAIILILIVVLILCFIFYNKKIQNLQTEIRTLTNDEMKEFFEGDPKLKGDEAQALVLSMPFIKDFEIPRHRLVLDNTKILGSGQFGTVIHGFIRSDENNQLLLPVAMKTVNQNIDVVSFKAFLSEVKIMAYLGDHDNIVGLLGTCTENIRNREIYIALEFCPLGNLGDYLKKYRENFKLQNSTSRSSSNAKDISLEVITEPNNMVLESTGYKVNQVSVGVKTFDLIKWSHDISNAMMYLTQKKVIHGDLAARNILLTENRVAKISDFGLSRQFLNYANYMKTSKIPVPWRWLAIESLKDMKFSIASDVWAFGVTMWEIFSLAEIPYGAWTYDLFFVDRLIAGDRLQRPSHANDQVYMIMKDCWEVEPAQRPTFQRIYLRLGEFILKASEMAEAEGCDIKVNSKNTVSETASCTVSGIPTKFDECETQL